MPFLCLSLKAAVPGQPAASTPLHKRKNEAAPIYLTQPRCENLLKVLQNPGEYPYIWGGNYEFCDILRYISI